MIEQAAQQARITCNIPGPRNDQGRNKLIATIVTEGIQVYCLWCKRPHLIARETCIAAWEHGERVQCHEGETLA